jgi:hypothetical protein
MKLSSSGRLLAMQIRMFFVPDGEDGADCPSTVLLPDQFALIPNIGDCVFVKGQPRKIIDRVYRFADEETIIHFRLERYSSATAAKMAARASNAE